MNPTRWKTKNRGNLTQSVDDSPEARWIRESYGES